MDLGLKGKSALVLASSGGLGRAIAAELAREGAIVTLFARRADVLAATADAIAAETGRRPAVHVGDQTKPDDVAGAVATAFAEAGRLDILVNNSGGPRTGTFASLDDAAWQEAFELTLLSYVRATRAALPHLRASGTGRILNLVSSSAKAPLDLLLLSNAFRTGVVGLTKTLASELGPDGILVNALGPGRVFTDRIAQLDAARARSSGKSAEEIRAETERSIPLRRYGDPAEFARMATFLVSPANGYTTGQTLLVDGGLTKAY